MTCCLRGECGHEPLREEQGVKCTSCGSSVHPICSYELPANGNGILHDGTLIHRRNLHRREDGEDWTLCLVCASSIALAIAEDAKDGRDGRLDIDAEVIAAVIHDSVLTAAAGNADNTGDDESGDGESTVFTNVAVVTEEDEEEDDEEGEEDEEEYGELLIPAEVEDVELSPEDVKQLVSEFIRKARPTVMEKGSYRNPRKSSKFAQMLLKIKGMLDSNTFMTKHTFWYTVRAFFFNKKSFEYYLDRLASDIGV
eukprot:scaffold9427_cov183-Skeletonema_dohrnii-CCMP3373.AAC.1